MLYFIAFLLISLSALFTNAGNRPNFLVVMADACTYRDLAELDRWSESQGDPCVAEDTRAAIKAARQGRHLYGPLDAK